MERAAPGDLGSVHPAVDHECVRGLTLLRRTAWVGLAVAALFAGCVRAPRPRVVTAPSTRVELGLCEDVINIHSYFETWHPNTIEQLPAYIDAVSDLIRETGGRQPLWMAETGYSTVGPRADVSGVYRAHFTDEHTEPAQAAALVRTVVTSLATKRIALLAWYRINDLVGGQDVIGDDNNRHLGIRRVDGSAKPAHGAFAMLAGLFSQPFDGVAVTLESPRPAAGRPVVHVFRLRDGRTVVAAWLAMPTAPARAEPMPDPRAASFRLMVPVGGARAVACYDEAGRRVPMPGSWHLRAAGQMELAWMLRANETRVAVISDGDSRMRFARPADGDRGRHGRDGTIVAPRDTSGKRSQESSDGVRARGA